MKEQLISLKERALSEIKQSSTMEEVDSLRVKYSGKKGELTAILKGMGKLSAEERPEMGKIANEVREAIKDSVYMIIHAAKTVLEKIEPEISADIIDKGIVLTGGGALLDGLDKLIQKEIKVPVKIADSPLTCVAEGTGIILENL